MDDRRGMKSDGVMVIILSISNVLGNVRDVLQSPRRLPHTGYLYAPDKETSHRDHRRVWIRTPEGSIREVDMRNLYFQSHISHRSKEVHRG